MINFPSGYQVQIEAIAMVLVIFGAHNMNILVINEVKIFALIKMVNILGCSQLF